MKNLITLILLSISSLIHCQEIGWKKVLDIEMSFITGWEYFRMQKKPLLSYEDTHDGRNWKIPFLIPKKYYRGYYRADIKISKWVTENNGYRDLEGKTHHYLNISKSNFYVIEKGNGLLGLKKEFFSEKILDSMQLNIYDSIFPYDNRFMAIDTGHNKFTFHSGNVTWGEWKDVGFVHDVDIVGFVRGVQFGVERVRPFIWNESQAIRRLRPEYPDYVYAYADRSLLSKSHLLIAAPQGKEDQLVEFIYYTNKPEKTGDEDSSHFYEMRYILPTQIKSIKERRLEKRLLSEEEKEMIFNMDNKMFFFIDSLRIEMPEEIIEKK